MRASSVNAVASVQDPSGNRILYHMEATRKILGQQSRLVFAQPPHEEE